LLISVTVSTMQSGWNKLTSYGALDSVADYSSNAIDLICGHVNAPSEYAREQVRQQYVYTTNAGVQLKMW